MRTSSLRLALLGGSTAALVGLGCFSSSSAPLDMADANLEVDAGSTPDSTTPEPEAAPPEAGPDATADTYVAEAAVEAAATPEAAVDAGPPPVTVVARSALGPEQGVTVVFQDAFSEILATVVTDVAGRASAVVPPGSQVTVYMGGVAAPNLVTIEAVVPGDVLAVYDPTIDGAYASVSITLGPDAGAPPGAAYFYGSIGDCYVNGLGTTVPLQYGDCTSQGKFPVMLTAQAGADGGYQMLGYTYSKGNTVAADGGITNVVMQGPWSTTYGTETFTTTDNEAGTIPGVYGWSFMVDEIANGVPTPSTSSFDLTAPPPSGEVNLHPGFADSLQAEVNFIQYNGGNSTQSVTGIVTNPAADGGMTFDLGQVLPLIDSVSLTKPGMVLTWGNDAGSLPMGDGVLAAITWGDTTDGGITVQGTWTLVAPPGVRTATLPAAPAALASFAPSSTAVFNTPTVAIVDADFISGYDQLRLQAGALPVSGNLIQGAYGNQAPALPVDGTLRLTAITRPGD